MNIPRLKIRILKLSKKLGIPKKECTAATNHVETMSPNHWEGQFRTVLFNTTRYVQVWSYNAKKGQPAHKLTLEFSHNSIMQDLCNRSGNRFTGHENRNLNFNLEWEIILNNDRLTIVNI